MVNEPSRCLEFGKTTTRLKCRTYSPRLHAAGDANLHKFLLVDDRPQIPCPTCLWRINTEIFDQKCNCFSTEVNVLKVPRFYYEVLFGTSPKKERDERKKEKNKACQSRSIGRASTQPTGHAELPWSVRIFFVLKRV